MKNQFKTLLSISILLIVLSISVVAKGKIVSGNYDSLLIGVNAQGVLTGYLDYKFGAAPGSCTFFIYGEKEINGKYKVKTWYPGNPDDPDGVIEGELTYVEKDGKKSINLRLDSDPRTCDWVGMGDLSKNGKNFEFTSAGNWESIRLVSSERVYLFKSFNAKAPQKIYIVKKNVVRVLRTKGDRVEINFINDNGRATKGWMMPKDFYALAP